MAIQKYRWLTSFVLMALALVGFTNIVQANHCTGCLHNAIEQATGNWYGSYAVISWTNPNIRQASGGQWTYHRTSTNHANPGTCFRYSEIGWQKYRISNTATGLRGLIVWDSGCSRQELTFSLSSASQYTFSQQYFLGSDGRDRYAWYLNGVAISNGITNFSYSTTVTEGGETLGVEAMGNTLASSNKKLNRSSSGTYSFIPWGGHTNYVDDAPYTNTNSASDPNNAFYSTGKE